MLKKYLNKGVENEKETDLFIPYGRNGDNGSTFDYI
jgi:hypothetical protein